MPVGTIISVGKTAAMSSPRVLKHHRFNQHLRSTLWCGIGRGDGPTQGFAMKAQMLQDPAAPVTGCFVRRKHQLQLK